MSTVGTQPQPAPMTTVPPRPPREIKIYGHTALFYWWPVWLLGGIMALVTYLNDSRSLILKSSDLTPDARAQDRLVQPYLVKEGTEIPERVYPDRKMGVIFTIVLLLVIIITNVPLRGLSSAVTIVLILFFTVLFAYLGWWDPILDALGRLAIHANMGFYLFFSTVLFIVWLLVFLIYDRLRYWRVTPGQITQETVFGGGQRSFDTNSMAFEKLRDDLFRHWILGFGSGDLIMYPLTAATKDREELQVHNVLFIGAKLRRIQEMIAMKPDETRGA